MQIYSHKRLARIFPAALCAILLFGTNLLWGAKQFPNPSGYVSDFANVVEPALEQQMSAICRELDEKTGAQIGVASFPDMGGDEIDGFTNRLFEQWMPGQKGVNNGILIVNAIAERKIRLEIGYGLEPIIPDAVAGRIRRDIMTPLLQEGRYGEAYLGAVAALAQIIAKNENVTLESLAGVNVPRVSRNEESPGLSAEEVLPFLIFMAVVILLARFSRRRSRGGRNFWDDGGPWIGGGFGGGGGGGGGFGGFGGGMSGGGGSSGGY